MKEVSLNSKAYCKDLLKVVGFTETNAAIQWTAAFGQDAPQVHHGTARLRWVPFILLFPSSMLGGGIIHR